MMKKKILTNLLGLLTLSLTAQTINIPDPDFKKSLVNNSLINTNLDNEIQATEATNFNGHLLLEAYNHKTTDYKGIEAFKNLTELTIVGNYNNFTIDLSKNLNLKKIKFNNNKFDKLIIGNNTNLEFLNLNQNDGLMDSLNLSQCINLKELTVGHNFLKHIDISQCNKLTYLDFGYSGISYIDLKNNKILETLICFNSAIKELDLTENKKLLNFDCSYTNIKKICITNEHDTTNYTKYNNEPNETPPYSYNCNVTSISETNENSKNEIIKAFDLNGIEVPIETTNKPIIYIYKNGKRSKVNIIE